MVFWGVEEWSVVVGIRRGKSTRIKVGGSVRPGRRKNMELGGKGGD